jgi:mono/diheme cytochrome c family protein/ketosteroid isomerase-like protein
MNNMKNVLIVLVAVLGVLVGLVALGIGSGAYNVAADEHHSGSVYWLIEKTRERSIAVRIDDVDVPELDDAQRIRRSAGNYEAMCAACHLAPGVEKTELSAGLYPQPPDLRKVVESDPARAFWIIKHGVKATGMPAWGKSMQDEYIWDMVAFLRALPTLSVEQYAAEVAASGGHSHGGGESGKDDHAGTESHDAASADHHSHESTPAATQTTVGAVHTHADGKQHVHEVRADTPINAAKALHAAMSSGDASAVERLLDPSVLVYESGNAERSRQEYAGHHLPEDLKFMRSVNYRLERQTGDSAGDLAWVASEARLTGDHDGKPVEIVSTETLVLKKATDGWKAIHIHWSSHNARR